jgi:hypothetical protein
MHVAQVRGKKENLLLAGLIGGPNKPQTFQPFIQFLVDQLVQGWEGSQLLDPESGEDFTCRVILAFSQHDYLAMRDMALRHDAGEWCASLQYAGDINQCVL